MAQGFIIIQDLNTSPLFDGSAVYCYVRSAVIGGQNTIDPQTRPNQDPEVVSADNSDIGSMWNRRKATLQYTTADNMQITLAGGWTTNENGATIGSELSNGTVILSPHKIMRMATSGRTFHLRGGTAIQYLIDGEKSHTSLGSSFYVSGSGIPVTVAAWSVEDLAAEKEYVTWTMSFIEDKDEINLGN